MSSALSRDTTTPSTPYAGCGTKHGCFFQGFAGGAYVATLFVAMWALLARAPISGHASTIPNVSKTDGWPPGANCGRNWNSAKVAYIATRRSCGEFDGLSS